MGASAMALNCAPASPSAPPTGAAGNGSGSGSAGSSGTAGSTGQGAAGTSTTGEGTAGTSTTGQGTAGTTEQGTAGAGGPGTAGAGGPGAAGAGAGGATGTAGTSAGGWKNYEYSGTWPNQPIAIKTVAGGKLTYTKIIIHSRFLAESCSIGDYNNDGVPDISSGRRWWPGPFTPGYNGAMMEHIYRGGHDDLPRSGAGSGGSCTDEINSGVSDDWSDFPYDMDGDGLTDIINIANCDTPENCNPSPKPAPQPHATAYWYKNPGPGSTAMWTGTLMNSDVRLEQHGFGDVDGDGKPEIYGACKNCTPAQTKGYYKGDWAHPTMGWTYVPVTTHYNFPFNGTGWLHGEGLGDIDKDGKADLLERGGAWISANSTTPNVTVCPGAGCGWVKTQLYDGDPGENRGPSHMYAADMDGDGDMDIVATDWAHGWGLAWYEQTQPLTFVKHQIYATNSTADQTKYGSVFFSEGHAMQVMDMNGDGIPDIVIGKMRFAHPLSYGDPDPMGVPYSYVLETKHTPAAATGALGAGGPISFVPHEIDPVPDPATGIKSGVGRQIAVGHINTDGIPDICVSSKLGLFVFLGQ
ncbi:MAG TPA: VCBS repeat-containing protein [Polyangia bacterium]|nr:VCBS repeat-containing protein [Polyangia bacterium]